MPEDAIGNAIQGDNFACLSNTGLLCYFLQRVVRDRAKIRPQKPPGWSIICMRQFCRSVNILTVVLHPGVRTDADFPFYITSNFLQNRRINI